MAGFRGSDETLDQEIATLEGMARGRLRRYTRDMNDLDRDLRELKNERARRKARAAVAGVVPASASASADA